MLLSRKVLCTYLRSRNLSGLEVRAYCKSSSQFRFRIQLLKTDKGYKEREITNFPKMSQTHCVQSGSREKKRG